MSELNTGFIFFIFCSNFIRLKMRFNFVFGFGRKAAHIKRVVKFAYSPIKVSFLVPFIRKIFIGRQPSQISPNFQLEKVSRSIVFTKTIPTNYDLTVKTWRWYFGLQKFRERQQQRNPVWGVPHELIKNLPFLFPHQIYAWQTLSRQFKDLNRVNISWIGISGKLASVWKWNLRE